MANLEHDLELIGLLCSRICHDLVNPIGAIVNGIEILAEEEAPEMREQAIAHIADSAERASQRLQYLRLALGAGGGPGSQMALEEAGTMAQALFSGGRGVVDWQMPAAYADRQVGRLLLNLILIGEESLPRGGRITVALSEDAGAKGPLIRLTMQGTGARLPAEWQPERIPTRNFAALSPRGAQICHTLLLAHAIGATMHTRVVADQVEILARLAAPL